MSAAEDVVHQKAMLADDLRGEIYGRYMPPFMESLRSDFTNFDIPEDYTADYQLTGDQELSWIQHTVEVSENFYIAKPMMMLANQVAPEMPDEDLLPHDLPAQEGFMWYAVPYRQIDIRRKMLSDNAILWAAHGGKVRIWHFCHRDDPVDSSNAHMRSTMTEEQYRQMPMLALSHIFDMDFNRQLPRGITWDTPIPWDAKTDVTYTNNEDGSYTYALATDQEVDISEKPRLMRSPLAAFIVTLWRLCQQTIASRYDEEPPRHSRRRLMKARLPVKPITVISLRRFSGGTHEEAGVEWQHQWVVRGHWRHQPYKENGEVVYRYIYINPYLKGPEDKPLIHREKVNQLIR